MPTATNPQLELADQVAEFYADPLRFVTFAYPWGETGALEKYTGPDEWQREYLIHIGEQVRSRRFDGHVAVPAIREAVASGHGIGKSTMVAWIVDWIMSTRPNCVGTITANTFPQLQSKTWAQIQTWTKRCITGDWFSITGNKMTAKEAPEGWYCTAQTCREENSEAFAGQHAASSTSFYIFDESSAIPEKIFEVAEGGLTDGEPMVFLFGNPTRSQGKFYKACFGSERNRWSHRSIDSRRSAMTNKVQIAQWIEDYGEDSDFVRVRVRGLPPAASDMQFIDTIRVSEAQKREALSLPDDALVAGLDVARGGADNCVLRFRRGADARSIKAIVIPGEEARNSMRLVSVATEVLNNKYNGKQVDMLFVDETGIGGPIVDRIAQLGFRSRVMGVQFGGKPPDAKYANMRAYMWAKCKEWLLIGSIDEDAQLEVDLTGPGYFHNSKDQLLLEPKEKMKDRGLSSPDHGDALALTFAAPVLVKLKQEEQHKEYYDGYSGGWMS